MVSEIMVDLLRPGGRIWTGWMGDTVVELGAGWIGAGASDSVHNLAALEGLIKVHPPLPHYCYHPLCYNSVKRQMSQNLFYSPG